MESCDVIAFQDALTRTSSFATPDVRVTRTSFNDVDRRFILSNGGYFLSADRDDLLFVEAVPIGASEGLRTQVKNVEISRRSTADVCEESTRTESGKKRSEGSDDDEDEEGEGPETRSPFGNDTLDRDGDGKKVVVVPREERGGVEGVEVEKSLIESLNRLSLSTKDQPSSRKTDSEESSDKRDEGPHDFNQSENSTTDNADVLGRGPTGGTAVAYPPPNTPNYCGGLHADHQSYYPGAKRSQFVEPEFTVFGGNDIFVDVFQPTKFRKGPQPVESEDLSAVLDDEASLPLNWLLSPKDIAEVLGSDDCSAIIDEFFLASSSSSVGGNIIPDPSQKMKQELAPYSPSDQFRNGSVVGELFPSGTPASSFLQHLHQGQQQQQQQPSRPSPTIFQTTNPITVASPLPQIPSLATNAPGKFFQPGRTTDQTQFYDDVLDLCGGGCTGFQAGEASPPESGFGGSDCSQSPHPSSMKGSPGREDDFSLESHENLAEIEAILNFIENDIPTRDVKHDPTMMMNTNAPPTKHRFPLDNPPPGRQPSNPPASTNNNQSPLINHHSAGRQPANPPSRNYHYPLENPPASQLAGPPFQHPTYSTLASFHPVQSSPTQRMPGQCFASNTSPGGTRNVQSTRDEVPAKTTMPWVNGTNSDTSSSENHMKDQTLIERKQLAKASSVIARLTRHQLVMPDSDHDTLLHLAIAKNERYLTEALISRLDRDKLTDSMINLKNKQGQTPLCLATVTNQSSLVRLLVERGADVNVRIPLGAKQTKSFCNPVHFAAGNGREWLRTLEQLLRAKAIDLSALDSDGCSALHKSVMSNGLSLFHNGRSCETMDCTESVRQLVIHGIDINQQDGVHNKTALNIALERGDFELFHYILDLAIPRVSLPFLLNARTGRRGDTLLHVAANLTHIDPAHQLTLIRQLISRGANPQLRNWDNRLPWELATRPQISEVLRLQVGVGA